MYYVKDGILVDKDGYLAATISVTPLEDYKIQTCHTFSQLVPLKSNIRITSNSKHRNERRAIPVQSAFCHCFLECSEWDKMDG